MLHQGRRLLGTPNVETVVFLKTIHAHKNMMPLIYNLIIADNRRCEINYYAQFLFRKTADDLNGSPVKNLVQMQAIEIHQLFGKQ